MGKYTKAVMASLVAGGTAYLNAQSDGVLTGEDIGAIVAAVLVAAGFVWAVPNDKAPASSERVHRA